MSILRRLTPHLMYLSVVLAIAAVCVWIMYRLHLPAPPMDHKVERADRISYYVVTHTAGPSFELTGTERVIKVVSHAILDGREPYDPRRRVSYGLRARVSYQGRVLWQHDTFIDSRQSKAVQLDDVWLRENAFTSRLDTEMTDDRVVILHLPEDIPQESMLELTLLGTPDRGLVRAYQQVERTPDEKASLALSMSDSRAEAMVQRSTYAPWALLSEEDKLQRLSHKFLRMPAAGEPGVDFETFSVFYTGFRLPLEALTAEEGMWLNRHRSVALNIVGPTTVKLELHRPSLDELRSRVQHGRSVPAGMAGSLAWEADPAEAGAVHILSVSEARSAPAWDLPVPAAGASSVHEIEVPPGLHSLHIHTDSAVPVRIDASGPPASQFGAIPYIEHSEAGRRLMPDERRFRVYETGPGRHPVIAGILVPEDPRARILRIDVRVAVPNPPSSDPPSSDPSSSDQEAMPSAALTFEFLDREDRVIDTEGHEVQAPYTLFERVEHLRGEAPGITDAVGIRMVAPAGTHKIRISAARDVALRLYRFLPGTTLYEPPYRHVGLSHSRWRFAPRERRQWFPYAPLNASLLTEQEQRSMLMAQVRLEPSRRGTSAGTRPKVVAVTPKGRPERHHILEPVPPDLVAETLESWPAGALSRLDVGVPTRFRFAGPSRPRIHYAVPQDQLGERVVVQMDGKPAAWFRITATRGYWNLPRVAPGAHEIQVVSEATRAALYFDRPPVDVASARLFRRRTVYALDAAPLEIEVRKPPGKQVRVTMVVYAPRDVAAGQSADQPGSEHDVAVRAVIGGGVPMRMPAEPFPAITLAERVVPLPEPRYPHAAMFEGVAGREAGSPRYITVPLGDDIVPGTHVVAFAGVGAPRMWARFFVTHQDATPRDRALQWRFRARGIPLGLDDDAEDLP